MPDKILAKKVAIVTGSGRGIGRSEAIELARHGASLVVSDFGVDEDGALRADKVVAEITATGGQAVAATHDLATSQGAAATVARALDHFSGLDILVINAGLRGGNPIAKLTEEQWDSVVNSHIKASFLMTKYAVPELR